MTDRRTIAEMLLAGADDHGDALLYRRGGAAIETVSRAALLARAQRAAAALRGNGVAAGDHVLLMLTSQADFIDTFLGTIWADAVPVPLYPPIFSRRPRDFIATFRQIADSSGARTLVVADDVNVMAEEILARLGTGLHIVPRSSWNGTGEQLEESPRRGLPDLALLQYTSGSTGTPKGVALSHANVVANMAAIGRAVKVDENDVGVTWLPLYHDMGLIGLLSTLYAGGRVVVLSPIDFAKDPAIWLRAITEHRGTLSPAPNFAFDRCLRLSDDELAEVDLSSWRVAFNGAEPVDPDTLREFSLKFAPYGFEPSAFYPVYGLAEHTLAVSFPSLGQGPTIDTIDRGRLATEGIAVPVVADHSDALRFVSVGAPLEGVAVEIRDSQDRALPDGHVGEVLVRSACVMTGYFGDPAATAEVLADGWLRTGDLGYLRDGMLYITGRTKDVIIRAGRNYYPTDIEIAAADVAGVRAGRVAAFSIPGADGQEHVVVIAESDISDDDQRSRLARNIGSAVAARVGFRPERIEVCARDTLPITSSGKLQRHAARARFQNGGL